MFDINLYLNLIIEYRQNFRKSQDKWSLTENLIYQLDNINNKKIN